MKKHYSGIVMILIIAAVLSGCGTIGNGAASLDTINPDKYVKLGQYKGLTVSADDVSVSDEEIQENLDSTAAYYTELVPVEGRAAKEGDTVNIDYEGKLDGVSFDGGTAQGQDLKLGSGSFIAGFEDGVVGMKVGDTKDLNLTFPAAYHKPELAGKDVVFTVTVNKISEDSVPEITDEFIKGISESCETVDEYKENVREQLSEQKKSSTKARQQAELLQQAVDNAELIKDVPEWLVSQNAAEYKESLLSYISQFGMDASTYFQQTGTSEAELGRQANDYGREIGKSQLVVAAISKAEGLELTDQEKESYYADYASSYGSDAETIKGIIPEAELENYLLQQKVMDLLYEEAVIK